MKKKTNKKATKKLKTVAKRVLKKTESFVKKTNTKAVKTAKVLQKQWKNDQPQREKFIGDVKKIGGDVIETIKKDVREIRSQK